MSETRAPRVTSDVGRWAVVPEWLATGDVSAHAIRMFAVLAAKYADKENVAYPSRRRLAEDMRCSLDTVDRASEELQRIGALSVEPQFDGQGDRTSNLYRLHFVNPQGGSRTGAATPPLESIGASDGGGRTGAATPPHGRGDGGRTGAARGGRTGAAAVTRAIRNQSQLNHLPPGDAAASDAAEQPSESGPPIGASEVVGAYAAARKATGLEPCDPRGRQILGQHAKRYLAGPTDPRITGAAWYDPERERAYRLAAAVEAARSAGEQGRNPGFLADWLCEQQELVAREHHEQQGRGRRSGSGELRPLGLAV